VSVLRVTILGCGSSGGVPRADGDWGACDPADPRNARTRCGLMLQQWADGTGDAAAATTVLIDTSPDLRVQLLRHGVRHIDAVVFSHEHADQTHGIDDVRAIAYRQRRAIPTYMDAATAAVLRPRFAYIFDGAGGYPAIMAAQPLIEPLRPFTVSGPGGAVTLAPLLQDHGFAPSLGFRVGPMAYSNDMRDLPPATLRELGGLKLWIVDALRYTPHPTHAHVDQALGWIATLAPGHAVLTNLHIDLDYAALAARLPPGVEPAVDGWTMDLEV
jgi:phosphoribosyl 1,2-cyclic phosphate phosphodiesterase